MKKQHLLNLPAAPAAQNVAATTKWSPSDTAWLNCVWQNWCCYSDKHSQKNTIIFTDLPNGCLPVSWASDGLSFEAVMLTAKTVEFKAES